LGNDFDPAYVRRPARATGKPRLRFGGGVAALSGRADVLDDRVTVFAADPDDVGLVGT
jgi:hypothetical protein